MDQPLAIAGADLVVVCLLCGFFVSVHWWACADEVSVAVCVVDAVYGGPVFVDAHGARGEAGLFAGVGA
ncbi:hypothetical protein, partial [Ruegeria faecimaris]